MKAMVFIMLMAIATHAAQAADSLRFYPYLSVGVGYKVQEPAYVEYDGKRLDMDFGGTDTALLEIGFETDYSVTFGLKHDSQWSTGWPFNDTAEYYKTELFIRYKIGGKQ